MVKHCTFYEALAVSQNVLQLKEVGVSEDKYSIEAQTPQFFLGAVIGFPSFGININNLN